MTGTDTTGSSLRPRIWRVLSMVIVFGLARVSGNPLDVMLPIEAMPEDYERLEKHWGLDKPVLTQYFLFLGNALQGHQMLARVEARDGDVAGRRKQRGKRADVAGFLQAHEIAANLLRAGQRATLAQLV